MRAYLWGSAAIVAVASVTALLAQTVDGIDVQAIKQRSADLQADAEAFVNQVKDRGDAFREDAAQSRDAGMANMQRVAKSELPKGPAGPVDFDEIVAGAASNATAGNTSVGVCWRDSLGLRPAAAPQPPRAIPAAPPSRRACRDRPGTRRSAPPPMPWGRRPAAAARPRAVPGR